jgi:hypothetical protein
MTHCYMGRFTSGLSRIVAHVLVCNLVAYWYYLGV